MVKYHTPKGISPHPYQLLLSHPFVAEDRVKEELGGGGQDGITKQVNKSLKRPCGTLRGWQRQQPRNTRNVCPWLPLGWSLNLWGDLPFGAGLWPQASSLTVGITPQDSEFFPASSQATGPDPDSGYIRLFQTLSQGNGEGTHILCGQ